MAVSGSPLATYSRQLEARVHQPRKHPKASYPMEPAQSGRGQAVRCSAKRSTRRACLDKERHVSRGQIWFASSVDTSTPRDEASAAIARLLTNGESNVRAAVGVSLHADLNDGDTVKSIRRQIFNLAKLVHPDRCHNDPRAVRAQQIVNLAKDVLSSPIAEREHHLRLETDRRAAQRAKDQADDAARDSRRSRKARRHSSSVKPPHKYARR